MPKTRFYEPQLGNTEQMQIRGFQAAISGTYVLLDDVITAIRMYAGASPENAEALQEVASWLSEGTFSVPEPVTPEIEHVPYEVHGAESDDVTLDVARVEIFPDPPDDPRPKWYARSIDTGGFVLKTTNGSFDQEWVIRNATERWPGIPIHLLRNSGEDSKWEEDRNRGVFPSLGPPIRRLYT